MNLLLLKLCKGTEHFPSYVIESIKKMFKDISEISVVLDKLLRTLLRPVLRCCTTLLYYVVVLRCCTTLLYYVLGLLGREW